MPITTAVVAANFALELEGQSFPVQSADGGAVVGVVVEGPAGASPFREKHLTGVQYEPLQIAVASFDAAHALFDWIKTAWQGTHVQKNGAVMRIGANGRPVFRREFVKAVIAETTIPLLDGSSHNPAYVTVNLVPQLTRDVSPPTSLPPPGPGNTLTSSNFRLSIDGLD